MSDAHTRNAEALERTTVFFVLGTVAFLKDLLNDEPYVTESVRLARAWKKPTIIALYRLDPFQEDDLLAFFKAHNIVKTVKANSPEELAQNLSEYLKQEEFKQVSGQPDPPPWKSMWTPRPETKTASTEELAKKILETQKPDPISGIGCLRCAGLKGFSICDCDDYCGSDKCRLKEKKC